MYCVDVNVATQDCSAVNPFGDFHSDELDAVKHKVDYFNEVSNISLKGSFSITYVFASKV